MLLVGIFLFAPATVCWSAEQAAGVSFEVCHGFGCRVESAVRVSDREWAAVAALFNAATPKEERQRIRHALAHMEQLAGRYSPIHRDVARNLPPGSGAGSADLVGQLDCVDEAVNATRFLELFQQDGLLRFHRVLRPAYRRTLFTQHWAAHVEEVPSGRRFVFDTWFYDNGQPPILVSSERWHDLSYRSRWNLRSRTRSTNRSAVEVRQR